MVNAFQQGQDFEATQARKFQEFEAEKTRQTGINALGDMFGPAALAPTAFAAVTGSERAERTFAAREEQRGITNVRAEEAAAAAQTEADQAERINATRSVIGFVEAGLAGGATSQDIVARIAPALLQLGVSQEEIGTLPQQLIDNPNLIEEFKGALAGVEASSERRATIAPIPIRRPDGSTVLMQVFSDGSREFIEGVTPLASEQAGRRADIAQQRVDVAQERITAGPAETLAEAKARGTAVGRARGERIAEDLPTSRTAIAAQRSKVRSMVSTTDRALDALNKAEDQISTSSTGFIGGVTQLIPGTPGFNLVSSLLPVVSQEFVTNLQNMRDLSETGGAVGNVSNAEGDKLQSINANLNIGQSQDQLLAQIEVMRNAILTSRRNVQAAFADDQVSRETSRTEAPVVDAELEQLLNQFAPVEQ